MSLAPRAVLVHRTTEYEELLARHGTHGQAAFVLGARGRSIDEVARRHERTRQALADVAAAVPLQWRHCRVERADLDRFLFAPEDVVVVVGQDGLVANAAKYLSGQPVVGIDTDPGRNPGVLVRHRPADAGALMRAAVAPGGRADALTMVEAVADDTQRLLALNEIYLGPPGHQTARYRLGPDTTDSPPSRRPPPASSWVPGPGPPAGCARCGRSGTAPFRCPDPPIPGFSGSSGRRGPRRRPAPRSSRASWGRDRGCG